jgi:hypothetical protein
MAQPTGPAGGSSQAAPPGRENKSKQEPQHECKPRPTRAMIVTILPRIRSAGLKIVRRRKGDLGTVLSGGILYVGVWPWPAIVA